MTTTTIDIHKWLTAIDQHPGMTNAELLTGYGIVGVETDQTPEQGDASAWRLHLAGFLWPIAIDGDEYTYGLQIPGR
jgi:hypothetical protein